MPITLSEAETEVREAIQDLDTVNPGIAQALMWRILNDRMVALKCATEDRVKDLTATATGLTFAAGVSAAPVTFTGIRRILHAFKVGSNSSVAATAEYERLEPWEMDLKLYEDVVQGVSSHYSAHRVATSTTADIGKWSLRLWRVPSATHFVMLRAEVEPTRLTGGTDEFDTSLEGAYAIIHASAAIAAHRLGRRQSLVQQYWAMVPEELQAVLGMQDIEPRPRRGEPKA